MTRILITLILLLFPIEVFGQGFYGGGGGVGGSDIASIGDCNSGACFDGSSDGGTTWAIYDGTANKITFGVTAGGLGADKTINFPASCSTGLLKATVAANAWTLTCVTSLTDLTIGGFTASKRIESDGSGNLVIDTGTLDLITTGSVSGKVPSTTDTNGMSVSAAQAYGYMHWATGAGTWALPAAVAGMSLCVYSTTAAAIVIDPNGTDVITLNGTALAAGAAITSASAAGDFICLMSQSNNNWVTLGRSGTWTGP